MRPGQYAAGDGSFGRSAGAAMGRGVLLLAVALLIGVVLLNATDDQPPGTDLASGTSPEGYASGASGATTTSGAPTTTAAPAKAPAEVKVLVVNASDVKGAAATATEQLKQKQYNALSPGNAAKVAESAVYFTADFNREASAIADALGIPTTLVKAIPTPPPADVKTANVLVVLGADHATRFGSTGATTTTAATAATGATTTTAKPAATTTTR